MPELPEVEVVRAGLERHVVGATIGHVEVLHPRPVRRHPTGPDGFVAALTGRTLTGVSRRGKYLWLPLAPLNSGPGDALLAHLGMSGQLILRPPEAPAERHLRVRFTLDRGPLVPREAGSTNERVELRFVDQRMFGGLSVSPGGAELPAEIAHIARDPVDPLFDDAAFVRRVRRSVSGIKRLLLTQTIVSGVGNIYADEALWRSRIHGERPGNRLTGAQVGELLGHVREVLAEAMAQGGTSFDALYLDVNGESGYFDRSLRAYGREDEPCERCGTPMRRVPFMNRSSYFCPTCQPVPRRTRARSTTP